jgi:hypothetical protein
MVAEVWAAGVRGRRGGRSDRLRQSTPSSMGRHRPPRWGGMSWDGRTQGSATLHPGLSPCAALRLAGNWRLGTGNLQSAAWGHAAYNEGAG